MSDIRHDPAPSASVAHLVDGNAIAGILQSVFVSDPASMVIECGECHAAAPLAEWAVEADRHVFIVRCRGCTRTLWTICRGEANVTLRVAGAPVLTVPAE